MSFYLLPLSLRFIYKPLHHFRVLAWMDCQHSASQEGTVFLGDCLVLVLRVNILKNLFRSEGLSIVVVAFDPKSRSVVVLIIGNVNIVFSEIFLFLFVTLISTNFHESIFILVLALNNMLLSKSTDALIGSSWADQVLFVGVLEVLILFETFLPFPSEIGQLISSHHEDVRRKHTLCLKIFIGNRHFRVEEIFYPVNHAPIL